MKKNRQFAVVIIVISICVAVFLISFFCYTLKEKGRKEEPDIDLEYADSIEYLLLSRDDVHFIYGENYLSGTLVSYEYLNGIVELGELYRINKNTLCNCVTDGGDKMEKVLQIDGTALLQVECCFSNQLESKHICKAGIVTIEWKKDRNGDYYVTKCSYKDDNDIRSLYNIVLKSDIPPR